MESDALRVELLALYERLANAAQLPHGGLPPEQAVSLSNLLAYRELRRHDIASLQIALADAGLSSLGRLEGQVLESVANVLRWLGVDGLERAGPARAEAAELLERRSRKLLGRPRAGRTSRIMVTLDHLEPDLPGYLRGLLLAGMDIARINGAHGTAADWKRLVEAVREAEKALAAEGKPPERRCHIEVDLSGPRIRIADVPGSVRLGAGDRFRLARTPGAKALPAQGDEPPLFTCTLPGALANVRVGESVFIDDGKFAAKVERETPEWIEAVVASPADRKRKVKPEKGLNFPETAIDLPALTAQDRAGLPAVAEIADIVGLSFVHQASDIAALRGALVELGHEDVGIVAKVETRAGARNLVSILAEGLKLPAFGVMIARGDLAIEVGFDELASYQENILCLCEAAHVPTIWATQVLETLARAGMPARAEITDAAEATRADCVMLNKGPHVVEAAAMLDRLLTSEHRHREKKRELFREFIAQEGFPAGVSGQ
jgi:pyruvate kinase